MKQKANSQYKPAIYARLSDDDGKVGTSLSIENQLDILHKYCKDNGFISPKVFFDDDKTGTDFDRDGFQNMYLEAQQGDIDLIIIKDTSRFGRNWVKSGDYFERIEEMGVRFISIQEGIDTIDPNCPTLKMLPFYFVVNDWHSQVTSEKIKAVFHQMAVNGKHISAFAPYGYLKNPNNKYKLIIDPYASVIVKRIYEMRLKQYSYGAIVKLLNNEKILSPSAYRLQTQGGGTNVSKNGVWNKDSHNYHMVKSGERRRYNHYNCATYLKTGKSACKSHYITEKDLMKVICADIHLKADEIICNEKAAIEYYNNLKSQTDKKQLKSDESEFKRAEKRLEKLNKLIKAAFEKSVLTDNSGIFTDYIKDYEDEQSELTQKIKELSTHIERCKAKENDVENFIKLMKQNVNITEIDRATAVELIEKIVVSSQDTKPREITIYYNFVGNI